MAHWPSAAVSSKLETIFRISKAINADRKQLIRFWQLLDLSLPETSFPPFPAGKKKFYLQLAKQLTRMDHGFALIAWRNDEAVGCICSHLYDKPESTTTPIGVMYNLWVEPSARRRGLATMLAQKAEELSHEIGAQGMQVSWRNDPVAEYFWRSRGYHAYETLAGKTFKPNEP